MTATILSTITGAAVASFTVAVTNAASGVVNISLSDTQTLAIAPGTYRWTMVGTVGSATRTYLEGFVEVAR